MKWQFLLQTKHDLVSLHILRNWSQLLKGNDSNELLSYQSFKTCSPNNTASTPCFLHKLNIFWLWQILFDFGRPPKNTKKKQIKDPGGWWAGEEAREYLGFCTTLFDWHQVILLYNFIWLTSGNFWENRQFDSQWTVILIFVTEVSRSWDVKDKDKGKHNDNDKW